MSRLAIMGGIGSGKTAVTDYLASRGAAVVDADEVARTIVEPGRPAWQQMRDAFGDAVLTSERTLDRAFVAEIVFTDASALRRLNHITHTAIGLEMLSQISLNAEAGVIAVALPLYRPMHRELFALDEVWCVWVDPEVAVKRLCESRGFSEDDARARLAAQMTNDERFALSDVTIENSGTLDELHECIDKLLDARGLLRG